MKNNIAKPSTSIFRKQIIEGVSIPAIIHNSRYFFVDIDVYEDGRVEYWGFEDLEHFKEKVNSGWIVLNIPDDKEISIHGLGAWGITNGDWIFSKKTFIDYVVSLIKEMNPLLTNIYKYTQKKINGVSIGENGKGTIYKNHNRMPNDPFPEKIEANSVNLFYKSEEVYWLVKINVFADASICISRLENPIEVNFVEFEKLIAEKVVLTEVPDNATINIYGLGSFNTRNTLYAAKIEQKLLEIKDILQKLTGVPTSLDICREAYKKYLDNPTPEQKQVLKTSYENVPDHEKMYVGDMDVKDIQVRMILYGEQEIEKWSHYQLAKGRGEELPTIRLPLPKDGTGNEPG